MGLQAVQLASGGGVRLRRSSARVGARGAGGAAPQVYLRAAHSGVANPEPAVMAWRQRSGDSHHNNHSIIKWT